MKATIAGMREALDRREVSAVELTETALDRLARHGDTYNAVVALTGARARAEAVAADGRLSHGDRSPLLGIPYGAKDIFGTRGTPTHAGSAATFTQPGDADATVIRRLAAAGSPLVAKLALVELVGFGTRMPGSSAQGPARTPWDLERWAGGSSGGSAAAVAAELVPFALGSETAGSVGSPAAWCGITGFRPSLGLIGRGGMTPLSPTLDKPGVLAHTASDVRTVVAALAGRDRDDPATRSAGFAAKAHDLDEASIRSLRIGYAESDIEEVAAPETRAAFRDALRALRDRGFRLVPAAIPQKFPYRETLEAIMNAEAIVSFRELVDTDQVDLLIDPEARTAVRGPGPTAGEVAAARADRRRLVGLLRTTWSACDIVLATNFARPWPIPVVDAPFGDVPIAGGNTAMVWAGNLAGLPAAFLPVGRSDEGLPVSIKLVGKRWDDARVLAVAVALQEATTWHELRPPYAPAFEADMAAAL